MNPAAAQDKAIGSFTFEVTDFLYQPVDLTGLTAQVIYVIGDGMEQSRAVSILSPPTAGLCQWLPNAGDIYATGLMAGQLKFSRLGRPDWSEEFFVPVYAHRGSI
jgi:hypothetical protein